MDNIKLLDCTLRDGMYVTDFWTSDEMKRPVIETLENAGVDIIECGFLSGGETKKESAVYGSPKDITSYITPKKDGRMYVAIAMSPKEITPQDIPPREEGMIDGIRIAFYKHIAGEGLALAKEIKKKGYHVMIQPSRISDYSSDELINLVKEVNEIDPFSLAIVDTLGNMYPQQAGSILDIYESYLAKSTTICFHFHNNMQLAFANTLAMLAKVNSDRNYCIDASIFGMGRAAGNLPIELIMDYMNKTYGTHYKVDAIIDLYSRYFKDIFNKTPWGYNINHFITAKHNCNPYYATYIAENYHCGEKEINAIISQLKEEEKINFHRMLAEEKAQALSLEKRQGE